MRIVGLVSMLALAITVLIPDACAMTIQVGSGGDQYMSEGDLWLYFKGSTAPSDPATAWTENDFPAVGWDVGPSGFGYGDDDDNTDLDDMEDGYLTVYIRKEFVVSGPLGTESVLLDIDYDDGFIAYLNGVKVAQSSNMPDTGVTHETSADPSHEAGSPETFILGTATDVIREGANVLAIEGHNHSLGSSDFSLIPELRTGSAVAHAGTLSTFDTDMVTIRGTTPAAGATSVTINGAPATFDPGDGSFAGDVTLVPGASRITVEARNASSVVVDSGFIDVAYVLNTQTIGGTITENTVLSGNGTLYVVDETIQVPAGITLTVEAGVPVTLQTGVSILVSGRLLANGSDSKPIYFTHAADGGTWDRIIFTAADDSRLAYCVIEYSDCEGDHKDYYDTHVWDPEEEICVPVDTRPPRDYHEAVVVVACHVDIEGCLFHKLPDDTATPEGDAIAVISDDRDHPGAASAHVKGCDFITIGQGVHTRYAYVLVEECYFTNHHGDNDDVDLYGESTPSSIIRNNLMINPGHDDMINPTNCSAIIEGNVVAGSDDHGIVLRGRCDPIVKNNVVYNCSNGGIAVQNTCDALLVNNTVFDISNGAAIKFMDHTSRYRPPYCLARGTGHATLINCIVWDCQDTVNLINRTDDPKILPQWRGSYVEIKHCNIEGGQGSIGDPGAPSTLVWGAGNIDVDPLFVDPASGDFHLQAGSQAIDAGTDEEAPPTDLDGYTRPCGDGYDLGAYEFGNCGSLPGSFRRADANADGRVDLSDPVALLLHLFQHGDEPPCAKAADTNDSGELDIADAISTLSYLFAGGAPPPPPGVSCGIDPTDDDLTCESYPHCP